MGEPLDVRTAEWATRVAVAGMGQPYDPSWVGEAAELLAAWQSRALHAEAEVARLRDAGSGRPYHDQERKPLNVDDMRLPGGKTCGACAHFPRCRFLLSAKESWTTCDWSPSRFRPAADEAEEGADDAEEA